MGKRLIYVEDAIEALHDEIVRRRIDENTNDDGALDEFDTEAILRRLPSAQPQDIARDIATIIENEKDMRVVLKNAEPQWIPVSERLPEEKQDVLLAFKHNMVVGFWEDILDNGEPAWYANSGDGWMTGTESVDSDGIPIAWMPLPEPWRGEKDG